MNNERDARIIHSDPPSVDSPILSGIVYSLSNAICELRGNNSVVENLLGFAISELGIVNSQIIYCGENSIAEVIKCLKEVRSVFERIGSSNLVRDIKDSIAVLENILEDSENLYPCPNEDEMAISVGRAVNWDYVMKYKDKIKGVRSKCPSCGHEFMVSSFNVSRSPYDYKCPNCSQSIAY